MQTRRSAIITIFQQSKRETRLTVPTGHVFKREQILSDPKVINSR